MMLESAIPSLAVAVARDDEILWEEAFGWADREKSIPADEHTSYSLASISKPITATGLMLLVEEGRLELDSASDMRYLHGRRMLQFVGNGPITGD